MPRPRPAAAPSFAGRTALVLAAALVLIGAGTPTARAHEDLVATAPAADTTGAAPASVELELSAPPQPLGTQVVVTAPGGSVVSRGPAQVRGSTVVQPLADGLAGGVHTVAWRVTSADGHQLSGTFGFTVAGNGAGNGNGAGSVAGSGAAVAPPVGSSSGGGWTAAGAAGAAALAAAAVLLHLRRRA